jgi:hypothetical protein
MEDKNFYYFLKNILIGCVFEVNKKAHSKVNLLLLKIFSFGFSIQFLVEFFLL